MTDRPSDRLALAAAICVLTLAGCSDVHAPADHEPAAHASATPERPQRRVIHTDHAPAAIGPYSQAVQFGDLLFCSGQIPLDPATGELVTGTIEVQTRRVLDNLGAVLKAAGYDFGDVVKVTVFLRDLDHYKAMNAVYEEYFATAKPARAAVQVARLPKDVDIEIECIAAR